MKIGERWIEGKSVFIRDHGRKIPARIVYHIEFFQKHGVTFERRNSFLSCYEIPASLQNEKQYLEFQKNNLEVNTPNSYKDRIYDKDDDRRRIRAERRYFPKLPSPPKPKAVEISPNKNHQTIQISSPSRRFAGFDIDSSEASSSAYYWEDNFESASVIGGEERSARMLKIEGQNYELDIESTSSVDEGLNLTEDSLKNVMVGEKGNISHDVTVESWIEEIRESDDK